MRGTIGVSGSRDSDREHALVICRACLTHRISFVFSGVSIRKQKNTIITITHSAFFIIHVSVMIHHQPSKRRHNAWLFPIRSITCISARTYTYKRPSLDVQPLYVHRHRCHSKALGGVCVFKRWSGKWFVGWSWWAVLFNWCLDAGAGVGRDGGDGNISDACLLFVGRGWATPANQPQSVRYYTARSEAGLDHWWTCEHQIIHDATYE